MENNVEADSAKLSFKYGAMNCGKSATLINVAYNYTEQGLKVVTIKPSVDTKGDEMIVSRGGGSLKVDILATPEMNLKEEVARLMGKTALQALEVILVDEAQFLTPEQVDQLFELAKEDGISVVAFGLKTDFQSHLFPGSQRLVELADKVEKIATMCRCGSQAGFNGRKRIDGYKDGVGADSEYVFEGDQVAIDGAGSKDVETTSYDSLCGGCYLKYKKLSLAENHNNQTQTTSV